MLFRSKVKIPGKTCIPEGTYKITLYNQGKKTIEYANVYPEMHRGMLLLNDVPGFSGVMIHVGNTDADTDGCILVGQVKNADKISRSILAYISVYKKVSAAILNGNEVTIKITSNEVSA